MFTECICVRLVIIASIDSIAIAYWGAIRAVCATTLSHQLHLLEPVQPPPRRAAGTRFVPPPPAKPPRGGTPWWVWPGKQRLP